MILLRALLAEVLPRRWSLALSMLAAGVIGLWVLVALAMLLDPEDLAQVEAFGAAAAGGAMLFAPLAALLLGIAGLIEGRALARALHFQAGAAVLLVAGTLLAIGVALPGGSDPVEADLGAGVMGGACCGLAPALILLVPGLMFAVQGLR